jgi:HSP20 family protein
MADLVRWEPFRRMLSLREAMDRFLTEGLRPFEGWPFLEGDGQMLPLDISEKNGNLVVEASLPGFDPTEVDVSIEGNLLTIKAERKREEEKEKEGKYYYHERHYGLVHRTVTLPVEVDPEAAEATFDKGELKLVLPKLESSAVKHIKVKAAK